MKFQTVIENISTINDLKRIANAYVIDYRALNKEELIAAIIKTSPQYYFKDNVQKSLDDCLFSSNRDVRTLTPIILKQILLNKDDFKDNCSAFLYQRCFCQVKATWNKGGRLGSLSGASCFTNKGKG